MDAHINILDNTLNIFILWPYLLSFSHISFSYSYNIWQKREILFFYFLLLLFVCLKCITAHLHTMSLYMRITCERIYDRCNIGTSYK